MVRITQFLQYVLVDMSQVKQNTAQSLHFHDESAVEDLKC